MDNSLFSSLWFNNATMIRMCFCVLRVTLQGKFTSFNVYVIFVLQENQSPGQTKIALEDGVYLQAA